MNAERAASPRTDAALKAMYKACGLWSDVRDMETGNINEAKCDLARDAEREAKALIQELSAELSAAREQVGEFARKNQSLSVSVDLMQRRAETAESVLADANKRASEMERWAESLIKEHSDAIPGYDRAYSFKDNLKRYELEIMAPLNAALAACRQAAESKQAHIDRLMLEYCPDEMTPEQLETWGKAQMAVPDCPHAAPFRYCETCKVSPCPLGFRDAMSAQGPT